MWIILIYSDTILHALINFLHYPNINNNYITYYNIIKSQKMTRLFKHTGIFYDVIYKVIQILKFFYII